MIFACVQTHRIDLPGWVMNIVIKTLVCLVGVVLLRSVGAQATLLTPLLAGRYLNGDGANSQWVQVASGWRGSTYGTAPWGTGIWSLADARDVLALPAHGSAAARTDVVQTYSGRVDEINFADVAFIDYWGSTWGGQALVPFFSNDATQYQDNYAARFTGYISILEPGLYNFGVLADDGFQFSLFGGNTSLTLDQNGLNPRDRYGFDQNLMLGAGLYGFDLLSYERLEAGVVNLAWIQPGGAWETVPQSHLFTTVPEPTTWLLMLAGLAGIGLARMRRVGA